MMYDTKTDAIEPTNEQLVEEAVNELESSARVYGREIGADAPALVREVMERALGSGLDRRQLNLALRSAAHTLELATEGRTERTARIALKRALDMDPYRDEDKLGETEANRRKAAAVAKAAREVAQLCLDNGERAALGELLRVGCERRGSGVGSMGLDVVWLFEAAFDDCFKGYAWVDEAELDLAGELLSELAGED